MKPTNAVRGKKKGPDSSKMKREHIQHTNRDIEWRPGIRLGNKRGKEEVKNRAPLCDSSGKRGMKSGKKL